MKKWISAFLIFVLFAVCLSSQERRITYNETRDVWDTASFMSFGLGYRYDWIAMNIL
jgi:hypothetical protein